MASPKPEIPSELTESDLAGRADSEVVGTSEELGVEESARLLWMVSIHEL